MAPKPRVSITLSSCPRCGWPEGDAPEAKPAPRAKSPPEAPASRRLDDRWGPRDFGLRPEQFEQHFTPDMYERWYWKFFCEPAGHKHAVSGALACWQEKNPNARQPGDDLKMREFLANWHAKICWPGLHTHGEKAQLDCVILHCLVYDLSLGQIGTTPREPSRGVPPEALRERATEASPRRGRR